MFCTSKCEDEFLDSFLLKLPRWLSMQNRLSSFIHNLWAIWCISRSLKYNSTSATWAIQGRNILDTFRSRLPVKYQINPCEFHFFLMREQFYRKPVITTAIWKQLIHDFVGIYRRAVTSSFVFGFHFSVVMNVQILHKRVSV